ncbi:OLC1v1002076C1 [Oldenlandia corymbosa var. corymbosa]|uniref:OLC1v1002076C1 n=1 Tax=Oldenlandia corymbosa var. corymbosa TaxID=529605 RepID=A0AAV1D6Z5_OLDCO|nr:OLC1v1002076C1 [Oldenlandia corymbosa var. corymbosa]
MAETTTEEEKAKVLRARAKAAEEECFKKGAKVEVNFNEPGFKGSWYTGTILNSGGIINTKRRPNKIHIQFDTLSSSSDHAQFRPLKEFVDLIFVRPAPPREARRSFQLSEEVDAFHKDGWWEGVVTAVHPPPSVGSIIAGTSYSVFFRSTREQIQFPESDLRLHREWVYGKWVPPLESSSSSSSTSVPPSSSARLNL